MDCGFSLLFAAAGAITWAARDKKTAKEFTPNIAPVVDLTSLVLLVFFVMSVAFGHWRVTDQSYVIDIAGFMQFTIGAYLSGCKHGKNGCHW